LNIVYVYADSRRDWNCSEWRCAIPARAINRRRGHSARLISTVEFVTNAPAARTACGEADLIVVQRTLWGPVLSAIRFWQSQGKVLIADFDDAYDLIPDSVETSRHWRHNEVLVETEEGLRWEPSDHNFLAEFKIGLRMVSAATTPSELLAADWQEYTTTYILPNYADAHYFQNVQHEEHDGIVIGWGGGVSHLESFSGSGVLPALAEVCRQRPQVQIMICGNDRRIFNLIPVPEECKLHHPFVPFARWPHVLGKFDIGIAPLYGRYDQRRSWLKAVEYLLARVPWVASAGAPYRRLASYGRLVRNKPEEWAKALLDLVDNLETYRATAATKGYMQGLRLTMDANVDTYLQTYEHILQNARTTTSRLQTNRAGLAPAQPVALRRASPGTA